MQTKLQRRWSPRCYQLSYRTSVGSAAGVHQRGNKVGSNVLQVPAKEDCVPHAVLAQRSGAQYEEQRTPTKMSPQCYPLVTI